MPDRVIKAVCGFANESSAIKEELKQAAKQRGIDLICVSRYRKDGIRQYISENHDCNTVILQETLQISSPYTPDDLYLLADERNVNIIIALNRRHYGNKFMRTLYVAGITNAVYEDDAYAKNIVDLIINGRSRKESREYYGIQSVQDLEAEFEIIDEERLISYVDYITAGGPTQEIKKRYEFIAQSLKKMENKYMMDHLSEDVKKLLHGSEIFHANQIIGKKKKRFMGWRKTKARNESAPIEELAVKVGGENTNNNENETIAIKEDINIHLFEEVDNQKDDLEPENSDCPLGETKNNDMIFEDISDLFSEISDNIDTTGREEIENEEGNDAGSEIEEESEIERIEHQNENPHDVAKPDFHDRNKKKAHKNRRIMIYAVAGTMVFFLFLFIGVVLLNARNVKTLKDNGHVQVREGDGSAYETEPVKEETEEVLESETSEQTEQTEPAETESIDEDGSEETEEESQAETEEVAVEAQVNEGSINSTANGTNEGEDSNVAAGSQNSSNQSNDSHSAGNAGSNNNTTTYVVNNKSQSDVNTNTSTSNDSSEQPIAPQIPDYQGRIYSGSEAVRIAQNESSNGVSIYIKSRESGEGYFSGTEVSSIIDTSCSYLAVPEKNGNVLVQLSFIQQ